MTESRIVEATGVAAVTGTIGLGKVLEAAMAEAVKQCMRDGITDTDQQRERIMAAHEAAKEKFFADMVKQEGV